MAIVKDEEQQQGQGTSQALGQGMAGQPQPQQPEEQQPQQGSSAPATIGASQPSQPSMPMPKQPKAGTGTFANLRNYLQAAQGGGQQRVAQAATQQVQKLGAGAQKGTQQAQEAFGRRMEAGSLKGMETAAQEAKGIVGTARGVTYQAPQQPAAQPQTQAAATAEGQAPAAPIPAPTAQPPVQPQQYFTPEQTQRFAEIINAQYQGPASLQQAGLYEQAAQKARTAQEAAQKTQTALGREQLLKDVFGRTRDYSRGVSKLDALLLNASQQGVKQLQEQAQPAAKAQEALQAAQNLSANEAAQRAAAIEGIRSGARQEFTGARTAEEQATEKRIDDLIKTPAKDESGNPIPKLDSAGKPIVDAGGNTVYQTEWDRLPEYFKSILNKTSKGQVQLSAEEMAVLGVGSGEGLYNLGENLIGNVVAERGRLITKNELARQQALSQLAEQDVARELQKDLMYTDMEKAGTQDLSSSLDVQKIREALTSAQKGFKTAAEEANLVGTGTKKVSRGNIFGKKTRTYSANVAGNVADMLRQAGYDVGAEGEGVKSLLSDKDLLNRYLGATSTSRDAEGGNLLEAATSTIPAYGATKGALALGEAAGVTGALGGGAGATGLASAIAAPVAGIAVVNALQDILEASGFQGASETISDVRNIAASPFKGAANIAGTNVVGDIFKGVGGAIGGIDTGAMRAYGDAIAKDLAIKDLQNKYAQFLEGQGFENRLVASQDPQVLARNAALQSLLRRQG